jgi:signal peptidase I
MAGIDPVSDAAGGLADGAAQPTAPSAPGVPTATGGRAKPTGRSLVRELPILVVVALVIAIVIKSFVVQAFVIPTGSMQNTLAIYDKILVNKLVYHFRPIHAGDIVVFDGSGSWDASVPPSLTSSDPATRIYDDTLRKLFDSVGGLFGTPIGQTDYVKRVIGVPGDHVVCCNAQGLITVNGVPLHERSYLYPGDQPGSAPSGIPGHFNVTVPAGYLWVLGDHRGISDDSRGHEADPGDGMIPEDEVIGRAFLIAWPPSQWRILPIPSTFEQPGITRAAVTASGAAAPYLPAAAGVTATFPVWWFSKRIANLRARARRRR